MRISDWSSDVCSSDLLYGAGVALVTPFHSDGSIDFDGLARVIEHQINGGMDYLVSLGTTGETATLSADERKAIWKFTAKVVAGRIHLIAGIGGNHTTEVVRHIKEFYHQDYNAILSVSPNSEESRVGKKCVST